MFGRLVSRSVRQRGSVSLALSGTQPWSTTVISSAHCREVHATTSKLATATAKRVEEVMTEIPVKIKKPRKKRTPKNATPLPSLRVLRELARPIKDAEANEEAEEDQEAEEVPTTALKAEVRELQRQNPEHVLLVQVGGFYEIYDYGGYLEELAALLHLKIARPSKDNRCCGFPLSKLKGYVEILIKNGKTVAIADQTDKDLSSKTKHHLRTITRVFTPGTVLDEEWIESRENNFLLCVAAAPPEAVETVDLALAWLDVSTGDFLVCDASHSTFDEHLARIQPREILCDEAMTETHAQLIDSLRSRAKDFHLTLRPGDQQAEGLFNGLVIEGDTKASFSRDVKVLDKYSVLQKVAAGNLLAYVGASFPTCDPIFALPDAFLPEDVMGIDAVTQTALEITRTFRERDRKGSLLAELDHTKSAAGSRLLASRLKAPSICPTEINRRLDLVNVFYEDTHLLSDVRELLADIRDMERAIQRIHRGKGSPGDYVQIIGTLRVAANIAKLLDSKRVALQSDGSPLVGPLDGLLERLQGASSLLDECDEIFEGEMQDLQNITEINAIKEGIFGPLDTERVHHASLMMYQKELEESFRLRYDIPPDKECLAVIDPRIGHYLAIQKLDKGGRERTKGLILNDPHAELLERNTAAFSATTVKFLHADWTSLSSDIVNSTDKLLALQREVFAEACEKVKKLTPQFVQTCRAIAETDVAAGSAYYAREEGCTRPIITDDLVHDVQGGRHPVVERAQTERESQFVDNDYFIGDDRRLWLLTGPNMGGKSTFLRQSALMSVIAQTGLYVPASSARLGIVDKIFARVGASDDLAGHKSTFMVEMQETATILNNATERSFVIMDEVGRGTSTKDGMAIAYAVLTYLHSTNRCRAVFATHYHELATRIVKEGMLDSVACYQTAILIDRHGDIMYTYRVEPGIMNKSHGIECARTAGLPQEVLHLAAKFYEKLEREDSDKNEHVREAYRVAEQSEEPTLLPLYPRARTAL
ncbi:muts domain V-domain-containing protein [Powellomyces hirtus]|nr:muts domain V-domain-containing protein [Powellomyces hirtus]